eukprot:12045805-Karenia_brevis.AAC.1
MQGSCATGRRFTPCLLRVLSANVLSWKQHAIQKTWFAQLVESKVSLMFAQECRDKWTGTKMMEPYVVCAGGADDRGNYGCR